MEDFFLKDGILEMFEVGPCVDAHELGYCIGRRFADLIQSRVANDLVLRNQLRPFANMPQAQPLLAALFDANKFQPLQHIVNSIALFLLSQSNSFLLPSRKSFPRYWDELKGTAAGSRVPFIDILLLNFRKEILPFLPKEPAGENPVEDSDHDCSDIIVLNDSMALIAHNEDANVALVGHTYLVKARMLDGSSFTAYTYAGELPSCAFAFNSHGVGFSLDSVPPTNDEILQGGIGRNFISRDLLEANSLKDALRRIHQSNVSVGHSYNLFDIESREVVNVESASRFRVSVQNIGAVPFFHANKYRHLPVAQVHDENSIARERRAALLPTASEADMLQLLGDTEDESFPIYMKGPKLYTLCTAIFDLDKRMLSIVTGNPKKRDVCYKTKISSKVINYTQQAASLQENCILYISTYINLYSSRDTITRQFFTNNWKY